MRIVVNGVEHAEVRQVDIYVEPEGEKHPSVRFAFHGGPITVPQVIMDGDSTPFLILTGMPYNGEPVDVMKNRSTP